MTTSTRRGLAWLTACVFALPVNAIASTCTGLGRAQPYNAWVADSFSAQSSDVEGRLLAGGNVSINHYSLGDKLEPANAGTSVIVGGDFVFPSGRIYYGNSLVRGSASGVGAPVRNGLTPGQTITDRATLPFDIAAAHTELSTLSTNLATLPANGTYRSQWGGLYLDGDNTSALQVFDLPAQLVLDAHTFEVKKIPAGATVLFTIRGANAGLKNMSLQTLANIRRRVLFNFPDATRLTLAGISVEGSILAPKAAIENPQGVIRGSLIAKSWNGMMQLNHDPFEGCLSAMPANRAPRITSTPETIARAGTDYTYQARAEDPDGDSLRYTATRAPAAAQLGATTGLLSWRPQPADIGVHGITLRAADPAGATAEQSYELRVVQDFCPIYPIAIPQTALEGRPVGSQIEQLPRGTGTGNYSWLSWTGANDAPTLAASLLPPGNSYLYVNPDNASDRLLNIGDWAQGAPGAMNAAAIRTNLDALKNQDIVLPVWGSTRGQGSRFDYRITRFASVRLTGYQLNGNGWISFQYKGEVDCYNKAPSATPQTLSTNEDTPLAVVLTGTDPDGGPLIYTIVEQPTRGTLAGSAPNLEYRPAANVHGDDQFRFRVTDNQGAFSEATVRITVAAVNDRPRATDQQLAVDEDTVLAVVLSGTDVESQALTYRLIGTPERGTLTGVAPQLTYTPRPNLHGSDAIRFVVNDGDIDSAVATIRIDIRPINDAPSAVPASLETAEGTALALVLQGSDPDGDALNFEVTSQPQHGVLSGTAPNLSFRPSNQFNGTDRFRFRVTDGQLHSTEQEVTIVVTPVNDAPVAAPQALTVDEDGELTIMLGGTDEEGRPLGFRIIDAPDHGDLRGTPPALIYSPSRDFHGNDELRFVVNDGELDSAPAVISIVVRPINDPPTAIAQERETAQEAALTMVLGGTDRDGDALTFRIASPPGNGSLSGDGASVVYLPHAGFNGNDQFEFVANDGKVDSSPARVVIRVQRRNNAPEITSRPVTAVSERETFRYAVLATDPDNDALTYTLPKAPREIRIEPGSGVVAGTVDADQAQPLRDLNRFCYLVPEDAELTEGPTNVRSPLFQRVRAAITKASSYVAPQTLAWHRNNTCLGCHVQTQALLGLQGAKEKADVDEEAAEYLLSEILASQQADGSIRRSYPQHSRNQTAFALWALSYVPDRARTLQVRESALRFFGFFTHVRGMPP